MNTTEVTIIDVVAIALALIIFVIVVVGLIWGMRRFLRQIQSGQGPTGLVLQQSRELAGQRLQVEKELLVVQKETNELLKQIIVKLEKKS